MEEISVTGTANVLMAAVLAKGTTQIYNAACEPYVQQLCRMLVGMGAKITGLGSNLLTIEGVDQLGGTTHRLLPDMIEVGIKIKKFGTSSVTYQLGVFVHGQDAPAAVGHFVHVYVDRKTFRSVPIPLALRETLEKLHVAS